MSCSGSDWTLKAAAVVCSELDCGSAVSVGERKESSDRPVWWISSVCVQSGSALRECVTSSSSSSILEFTCSDSVRLLDGTSLCSGRLEVKSNQSNQSNQRWSSVCEADFDQQDAEVVCRELGCGAPSVLQGALYGEVEAPMWTKEFQCGGHESALLDCRSSGSARNTCSPGKAVGLTCSEPVRLVGGASRCAGTLELKHQGVWRPVGYSGWTLKTAAVACRELDCGSAVSVGQKEESSDRPVWRIRSDCVLSGSALRECVESGSSSSILNFTCSDSVRLLDGTSLCSGRLEVKSNQSNQSNQRWSSVCEADFDQQDAEVVCRELGCGAPSGLQGVLYGEVEAPMWTKEFQCGGHESALLDCRSSGSARNTCSPGKAVGLTCSEPDDVRLVGGASRCAGTLELKHQGDWRPVGYSSWTLKAAAVVCRKLDCGSAVSVGERKESSVRPVWRIWSHCVQSGSALRECVTSGSSSSTLNLTCSDLLLQPNISVSSSGDGVSEAQQQGFQVSGGSTFTISCSIQPQYPGGSFQLAFTSSITSHNYTQPAVNHSAHFLFPAAEPAHQGSYSCVYHVSVFSHDLSSESRRLSLTVSDSVRLLDGTSLCSGRLEVKSNQSNQSNQWWSSVCEADFDQQDAEVVCRELGCGAPSVLQGALYGEVEAPMWTKEFQCGGHESALLDCRKSGSARNTCSPGKAVGLTCSEPVRLVGGASRCAGTLEVKHHGDWRPVSFFVWILKTADVACRDLDCGSAVSVGQRMESSHRPVWSIRSGCVQSGSALRECVISTSSSSILDLTCSEPVRLVGGASRCAGTLEVKHQGDWRLVRYFLLTLKEAAVVCRDLDCGTAVSVGEKKESSVRQVWSIRSGCVQSGSALRECVTSTSSSSILDLTCSGSVTLVGGASPCAGTLELKHQGDWRPVTDSDSVWTLKEAAVVCRELGCGSAVSVGERNESLDRPVWRISSDCVQSGSALRECATSASSSSILDLTCSDPTDPLIKEAVLPLTLLLVLLLVTAALCFYCKVCRGQKPGSQEDIQLDYYNKGVCAAEGGSTEEEGAQGAE